jgi:hypothetical protein
MLMIVIMIPQVRGEAVGWTKPLTYAILTPNHVDNYIMAAKSKDSKCKTETNQNRWDKNPPSKFRVKE